jgi:hypothetical protein
LRPDVDTPFVDYADVVNRLLPYHVFQQPQEDLAKIIHDKKGKGKATENNLGAEIAGQWLYLLMGHSLDSSSMTETKFALECLKRKEALKRRFRKAAARAAKVGARIYMLSCGYVADLPISAKHSMTKRMSWLKPFWMRTEWI